MATLYCDESGFSGPNLYHAPEPYFTYAGVLIEPPEAQTVIETIKSRSRWRQGEIKFSSLVGRAAGVEAIDWLLAEYAERAKVWFANKKYATAAKFFEYVFEPVLSGNNLLFYVNDFHRFIANLLYAGMASSDRQADELLAEFQQLLRACDAGALKRLLTGGDDPVQVPFHDIAAFAIGYRDKILEEIEFIGSDEDLRRWTMDLTASAFVMVARKQAERRPDLTIYCDDSKPLKAGLASLSAIVQADFSTCTALWGGPMGAPATLKEPVRLVKVSRDEPGVQVADLFAGVVRHVVTPPGDELSRRWHERVWNTMILPESMEYDLSFVDVDRAGALVNAHVLKELARRARLGLDPLEGMHLFYRQMQLAAVLSGRVAD